MTFCLIYFESQLSKMGFRNGDRLGKDGKGRAEPIAIGTKNGRMGVGLKQKGRVNGLDSFDTSNQNSENFLDVKKKAFEFSKMQRELDAARRLCREMDSECGIKQSHPWLADDEPRQNLEDAAASQESRSQLDSLIKFAQSLRWHCT
jgi:hypothetical protein